MKEEVGILQRSDFFVPLEWRTCRFKIKQVRFRY